MNKLNKLLKISFFFIIFVIILPSIAMETKEEKLAEFKKTRIYLSNISKPQFEKTEGGQWALFQAAISVAEKYEEELVKKNEYIDLLKKANEFLLIDKATESTESTKINDEKK